MRYWPVAIGLGAACPSRRQPHGRDASGWRGRPDRLDELERVIDEVGQGGWSTNSFNVLTAHFRDRVLFPPAPAKPIDSLSEEIDRKQLVKELKAQRSRLRERVPEVEATEAREAAARVQSYMLPAGHELELVLRYEAALDRKLHKVMDRLRQIQADRRAAEAADAAEGDQPAAAG
jgi:hypothetical protein